MFIVAVGSTCLAQSDQPQSLGDLAKKKTPAKKAVLVLNEDDLPSSALPGDDKQNGSDAEAAVNAQSADTGKADKADKQVKKDADASKSAEQRTNELKEKLSRYQKEEDVWKQSAKEYEDLIASEPSEFRRQMYEDSLNNDKHNAALYQQKIDEIQKELAKPQPKTESSGHSDSAQPSGSSQP
jgi:hypothetical protein